MQLTIVGKNGKCNEIEISPDIKVSEIIQKYYKSNGCACIGPGPIDDEFIVLKCQEKYLDNNKSLLENIIPEHSRITIHLKVEWRNDRVSSKTHDLLMDYDARISDLMTKIGAASIITVRGSKQCSDKKSVRHYLRKYGNIFSVVSAKQLSGKKTDTTDTWINTERRGNKVHEERVIGREPRNEEGSIPVGSGRQKDYGAHKEGESKREVKSHPVKYIPEAHGDIDQRDKQEDTHKRHRTEVQLTPVAMDDRGARNTGHDRQRSKQDSSATLSSPEGRIRDDKRTNNDARTSSNNNDDNNINVRHTRYLMSANVGDKYGNGKRESTENIRPKSSKEIIVGESMKINRKDVNGETAAPMISRSMDQYGGKQSSNTQWNKKNHKNNSAIERSEENKENSNNSSVDMKPSDQRPFSGRAPSAPSVRISLMVVSPIKETSDEKIKVTPDCSIKDLRRIISEQQQLSLDDCNVCFNDHILRDGNIAQYGINNNDTIIVRPRKDGIRIKVECEEYDFVDEYDIGESETVANLKERLREQLKVNIERMSLLFNEVELQDDIIIRKITKANRFTLILRIKKIKSLRVINYLGMASAKSEANIIIDPHCTIKDLRQIIINAINIGSCDFYLYHGDRLMEDGNIRSYKIKNNETLTVRPKKGCGAVAEQFMINVILNDKGRRYLIDDFETVEAFKLILREQHNVNVRSIKLLYEGTELQDGDVIREMGLANGSTIMLQIDKIKEKKNVEEIVITVSTNLSVNDDCDSRSITVNGGDTIGVLRQKLDSLFGIASLKYVVTFNGEILKNENIISTYNINDGDEIILTRSVLIRYFAAGDNYSAKVNRYAFVASDRVSDLKTKIMKKLNIAARFINLTHDGVPMEDEMILEDYGIENESYLMMVSTLAGGCNDVIG